MTYPATLTLTGTDKKIYENSVPQTLTEYKITLETILNCPTCLQKFRKEIDALTAVKEGLTTHQNQKTTEDPSCTTESVNINF
jgi:hypothetical protein